MANAFRRPARARVEKSFVARASAIVRVAGGPALVYLVDAFVLNHGLLSVAVAALVFVVNAPGALQALGRRNTPAFQERMLPALVYALVAGAVVGTNELQNAIARSRAEDIVVALEGFERARRRYPTKLEELAPGYLTSVPKAKYLIPPDRGAFHYEGEREGSFARPTHSLSYLSRPPSETVTYCFEQSQWTACE